MALAARIGISAAEWRRMTPRELAIWARSFLDQQEAERLAEKHRIFNLAALIRTMVWAKHQPSFESVFPEAAPPKQMDDEEMFARVRALNAMFGGKEA